MQTNSPKDDVREYDAPEGIRVREIGSILYGYSMTIDCDGKRHEREFGNQKASDDNDPTSVRVKQEHPISHATIDTEREPLADVNGTDIEVKVIVEMPGVKKEEIQINGLSSGVEIVASNNTSKYQKKVELLKEAVIGTAKSVYKNGILKITFSKKIVADKPKAKQLKID